MICWMTNMSNHTVLKWVCGTIIACVALIMYFSIFPHSIDINVDMTDNVVRLIELSESIAKLQQNINCTCP